MAAGGSFDKMGLSAETARPLFREAARWLDEAPPELLACLRSLTPPDAPPPQGLYAWAEAETPGLGWIAFDAVRNQCADDAYVRVAVGFDALGAAPFRAAQSGGGGESIDAAVKIEQAAGQSQN